MTVRESLDIAVTLIPDARIWVRKSSTALDEEIQQTAAACLLDLQKDGVVNITAEDPLIKQAVKLYLKAHFGFSEDSAKYDAAYEHLKASLSLSSDYNGGGGNG